MGHSNEGPWGKVCLRFDYKSMASDLVSRVGTLHTEAIIPKSKSISNLDRQLLNATVNGITVSVAVDMHMSDSILLHI